MSASLDDYKVMAQHDHDPLRRPSRAPLWCAPSIAGIPTHRPS